MTTSMEWKSDGCFNLNEEGLRALVSVVEECAAAVPEQEKPPVLEFTVSCKKGHKTVRSIGEVLALGNSAKRNPIVSLRMTAHTLDDDRSAEELPWLIFFEFRRCGFFERRKDSFAYRVKSVKHKAWAENTATALDGLCSHLLSPAWFRTMWLRPQGLLLAAAAALGPYMVVTLVTDPYHRLWARTPNVVLALAPFFLVVVVPALAAAPPVHAFSWGFQKYRYIKLHAVRAAVVSVAGGLIADNYTGWLGPLWKALGL
jgi:hypothetical protein